MSTVNRSIESDNDRRMAIRLLEARPVPFTFTLTDGKHRSTAQNKLQHMWMAEIAQQKGDMTAEEARGYCKLTIGVPILRSENAAFAKEYDDVVKPLPYEAKLKLMMVPFDFGVTRLMTTKQKTQYLDAIAKHFGEQGIILTMPEDLRREIELTPNTHPDEDASSVGDDESVTTTSASSTEPDQTVSTDPAPTAEPANQQSFPGADAGSDPLIPEKELVILRKFARDALKTANTLPSEEGMKKVINRWLNGELVNVKSESGIAAIKSIRLSVAAIMRNDGSVNFDVVLGEHAHGLGCTVEELGG
jgi:hypothetical protein